MDFAELSDALGNKAVWIYLSTVVVAVWEVVTNTEFLDPSVLTEFISPVAHSAGLDLLTPDVYRACLRKILAERFLPLARMLRDACLVEPLEFEAAAGPLFDPIAQENVTSGFRINGAGNIVMSLPNLLRWVLTNGLRSPAGYGTILSVDRVRRFGVAFPAIPPIFLQHVNTCDNVLSVLLDTIAVEDSLHMAHGSVNRIVDDWNVQTQDERLAVMQTLTTFMDFWELPEEPPVYTMLANSLGPAIPMQGGLIQLWGPGGLAAMGLPPLQIVIPPVNYHWPEDEASVGGGEEIDESDYGEDDDEYDEEDEEQDNDASFMSAPIA